VSSDLRWRRGSPAFVGVFFGFYPARRASKLVADSGAALRVNGAGGAAIIRGFFSGACAWILYRVGQGGRDGYCRRPDRVPADLFHRAISSSPVRLLGMDDAKAKVFDIAIQTGAILAVIIVYWKKIRDTITDLPHKKQAQQFALNVAIAFFPAVVLGLLFGKAIKAHLFTPVVVASAFIIGGVIILWAERRQTRADTAPRILSVDAMRWTDALKVGLVQCLAMIPGTSRSGSMAAAVASGCSMGNRWLPSSIMMRPPVIRRVSAMPTWRISTESSPPMNAVGQRRGCLRSRRSRLWGSVL
jgi:hypothetical protein